MRLLRKFNSLLALEGQEWRDRRVKMTPIFTSSKMKMMFETVDLIGNKTVEVVDKNIRNNEEIEVRELTGCFTADVIGNKRKRKKVT